MHVIEDLVADRLTERPVTWQIHVAGMLDVFPDATARALKLAEAETRSCRTGAHLTLAVGYGGRQEVLEAIRLLLQERSIDRSTLAELVRSVTSPDICTLLVSLTRT